MAPTPDPVRGVDVAAGCQRLEAVADLGLDCVDIDVADDHDRRIVRSVPGVVEAAQQVRRHRLDRLVGADGLATVVLGAVQVHRLCRAGDPALERLVTLAPLVQHDALLLVDLVGLQGCRRQPFAQHVEPCCQVARVARRHGELVDRLVVRGVRIDVCAEGHAEPAKRVDQFVRRVLRRAVEQHVLEEVSGTRLIGVFLAGAGVDRQSHLGAAAGSVVRTEVHGEPVRKGDDPHVGVDRHRFIVCGDDRCRLVGANARVGRRAAGSEQRCNSQQLRPPARSPHRA